MNAEALIPYSAILAVYPDEAGTTRDDEPLFDPNGPNRHRFGFGCALTGWPVGKPRPASSQWGWRRGRRPTCASVLRRVAGLLDVGVKDAIAAMDPQRLADFLNDALRDDDGSR